MCLTMYAILHWLTADFVCCLENSDRSVMLFNAVADADRFISFRADPDSYRVISIAGVAP